MKIEEMVVKMKQDRYTGWKPLFFPNKGQLGGVMLLLVVLLIAGLTVSAQTVGDHLKPMKYSTHTYSVTMGKATNKVDWQVYDSTATRERIDDKIDLPYVNGSAYTGVKNPPVLGASSFTIEFSGSLTVGKKYALVYREEGNDLCYNYQFLYFVIQPALDIDIVAVPAQQCPDVELQYLEGTGAVVTQTTVNYHVVLRNNDYNPPGNWYFRYDITATGQSGASSTIQQIVEPNFTFAAPPLNSTYGRKTDFLIAPASRDILFIVTYNDVQGVRQKIDFVLTGLEGAFGERDIDVINGTLGQNEISHFINALPAASYILAMD